MSQIIPRAAFSPAAVCFVAAVVVVILSAVGPVQRAEAVTLTVNSADDVDDGTCNVAHCSFREAINTSNSNGVGLDSIQFIIGSGPQTITPLSALPAIVGDAFVFGTAQPGWVDDPIIEIDGSSAGAGVDGITFSGTGSRFLQIRGLIVNQFGGDGIEKTGSGDLYVDGSWIGTDASGGAGAGNGGHGIHVSDGELLLGYNQAAGRTVISGNTGDGVRFEAAAETGAVRNTNIGTDPTGTIAVPNGGDGIESLNNTCICALSSAERNVISGNTGAGIRRSDSFNGVQNNLIGTDISGTGALGNGMAGVVVEGGADNVNIGFNGVGNVIAFNSGGGVSIGAGSSANLIHANSIHSNTGAGITTTGGLTPPTITTLVPVSGTTCASCLVDVYSDAADEGEIFHGTAQATAGGAWAFYGPVSGPNVTATTRNVADTTSAFSTALAKPGCTGTCLEGFWHVDYVTTGPPADHFCTAWVNQSGNDVWGHQSCTDGLAPDFTGTKGGGSISITGVYPGSGATYVATGTYTATTASGTWACTLVCVDSGTWTATKVSDVAASIPAGGGSDTIGTGAPAATISVPVDPASPAVTVDAFPLGTIPVGALPVRTAYDFGPDGEPWSPTVDITVTFVASTDLPPAPYNDCNALAMYVLNEATNVWSYDGPVSCSGSTFTASLDSFSVRGFFANVDSDGDGVDDGYDDCPQTVDGDAEATDLTAYLTNGGFGYDLTWPNGDNVQLVPCDPDVDDDNDGLTDTQEAAGCAPFGPTNPLDRDSDGDNYLDGAECTLGKNPNSMLAADRPSAAMCGASTDTDNDGMLAYREYCFYNTNPANANTDGDVRPPGTSGAGKPMNDGCEAASVNRDYGIVNVIDLQQIASATITSYLPGNPKQVDFDYTKDGNINVIDLQQVAARATDTNCQ